jgi:predicted branched-subunit amino acid permease
VSRRQRAPVAPGYRDGVRAALPIGIAAFAFGVSFGVLARSAGMGRLAPVVMSLTTFAGSAQFAAASILAAGGGMATAVAAASSLEGPWWLRALTAQLMVDESWAIAQRDEGRIDRHLLVGAGLLLLVGWVGGTAVGAVAGNLVADPASLGLDAAFPALFLALLAGQLAPRETQRTESRTGSERPRVVSRGASWVKERSRLLAAVGGALIALALMPVAGPGIPIIAASVACLIGARRS